MEGNAHSIYLETEVLTATPQKLRLMLIEGAVRFATQARQHFEGRRTDQANVAVSRCRAIIAELQSVVRPEMSEVARRVRDLYTFLFKTLIEVQITRDAAKLSGVLEVLQAERETWQQLCRQMSESPSGRDRRTPPEIIAPLPLSPGANPRDGGPRSGGGDVCFEA